MEFLLKQINKDLYSAEFEILENDKVVGKISLQGKLGSMEASLDGSFYDKSFKLDFVNKFLSGNDLKFRPYYIIENDNIIGEIYQTCFKKSILSESYYTKCIYEQKDYTSYSIGLGEKSVTTVYCNEVQISEIHKDGIVYNDLYIFELYADNREDAYITVLDAIYGYILGCYEPGIKVSKSVSKHYNKTTDKYLISKYDPEWIKNIKNE